MASSNERSSPVPPDGPLSSALRAAVLSDGRTVYALAKAAGVGQQVIGRWLAGQRDLKLTSADKLAVVVGVRCACSEADRKLALPPSEPKKPAARKKPGGAK